MSETKTAYPIVDLFAGLGGLGEGFAELASKNGTRVLESAASIEKDNFAHQTLLLRHFYRSYLRKDVPDDYYAYLEKKIDKTELIERNRAHWKIACSSALNIALGNETQCDVYKIVKKGIGSNKKWALIGDPPCQAYSLVGRSRMMGKSRL